MKIIQPDASALSNEVRDLLYRIDQSATGRQVAEPSAIPERTLRRWCISDAEFSAARSLAGELGIKLLT